MPSGAGSAIGVSNHSYRTVPSSARPARSHRSVERAPGPREPVADGLFECVPGGGDDVLVHPDGGPGVAGAVARLDQHPGDRPGAGRALQDADLEVGQLQGGELGEGLLEGRPERPVERVDRAVALADGDDPPAPSVTVSPPESAGCSTITRQDSTVKCRLRSPASSSRSSSSKLASAASNE